MKPRSATAFLVCATSPATAQTVRPLEMPSPKEAADAAIRAMAEATTEAETALTESDRCVVCKKQATRVLLLAAVAERSQLRQDYCGGCYEVRAARAAPLGARLGLHHFAAACLDGDLTPAAVVDGGVRSRARAAAAGRN